MQFCNNTKIWIQTSADSLREQGNQAVRVKKFPEAILHYTYAIKLDPENYALYSNRSYAHLMLKHYYLALADAKEAIFLNPAYPKGYFRKGWVTSNATALFYNFCL